MKLMKYFRKYSRVLVLVVMSLLLVVFLIGDVISRAAQSRAERDMQIAQVFGEPFYQSELRRVAMDLDLVRRLGINGPPVATDDQNEYTLAAALLIREAERLGVRISRQQVIELLRSQPGAAQRIEQVRKSYNISLNDLYATVARVLAPIELFRYQLEIGARESLPRLEKAYRDRFQTADVRLSAIEDEAFFDQVPEPTEQELQKLFEEGRDRDPATTDDKFVFGYRIPDRVAIEYVTVDPQSLLDQIVVTTREARKYYERNKERYRRPVQGPTLNLDQQNPPTEIPPFEQIDKQVRDDVRRQKAIEQAQRIINRIRDELRRPWIGLPRDQHPPADAIPPLEQVAARYADGAQVIHRTTDLLTADALRRLPGIGRAAVVEGGRRWSIVELAFRVEGLFEPPEDDTGPYLRLNEPGPVVYEYRGVDAQRRPLPYQAYLFRVIKVAPAGPPASLDEVRDQVVRDAKTLKAHELAGQWARRLAERARKVGLGQALAEADDLRAVLTGGSTTQPATQPSNPQAQRWLNLLGPITPPRFTRAPGFIPQIGFAPKVHEALFELADQPADGHRVAAVSLATQTRWVVGELLKVHPIYRGDFEAKRPQLEAQLQFALQREFLTRWFDPDEIRRRTGYVEITPDDQNTQQASAR